MGFVEEIHAKTLRRTAFDPELAPEPSQDDIARYLQEFNPRAKKYKQTIELSAGMGGMLDALVDTRLTGFKNNRELIEKFIRDGIHSLAERIDARDVSAFYRRQRRIRFKITMLKAAEELTKAAQDLRQLVFRTLQLHGRKKAMEAAKDAVLLVADTPPGLMKTLFNTLYVKDLAERTIEDPDTGQEAVETIEIPDLTDEVTDIIHEVLLQDEPVPDLDLEAGRVRVPGIGAVPDAEA